MKKATVLLTLMFASLVMAQNEEKLPYYQIPDYPETYTAGAVAARMIDGLGFRYYWATQGLTDKDLNYKPSESGRTSAETIDHIFGLSKVIVNATLNKPNIRGENPEMTFEEKRRLTLNNIKTAADIMRKADDMSQYKIVFGEKEYPFWNNINGPIADAIWHCGQVVMLRRASGNPFNSKVSVFNGKLRE
ncbi:hypothetical protein BFR04_06895 [Gaetbulibacter sp. 4G1]|nr:hypothetical protein [Gaetbulibacter sp. 4G1]PIA77954.1 hypothetical protein BFR04_06895 [Gaetbulibacter sp. 4G1]